MNTEPTDEQVERAWHACGGPIGSTREQLRLALRAAMNPPKEPEITVTEEMIVAGQCAYSTPNKICWSDEEYRRIYRAMFLARPKIPAPPEYLGVHWHRRKDDPK